MVLIMSEYNDNSTVYVCQWLMYYKVPFVRIDLEDRFEIIKVEITNDNIDFVIKRISNDEIISIKDISTVWYRRGNLELLKRNINFESKKRLSNAINNHYFHENQSLEYLFYTMMKDKPHIGTFDTRSLNKLEILYEASKLGIKIPVTFICNSKNELLESQLEGEIVTKAISEGFRFRENDADYFNYTERINLENISTEFHTSLFQEEIIKEADIRSFYLNGKFYSMAIISQNSEQTVTDFRKYLVGEGNRSFPFKLPDELEKKLQRLMNKIRLNTGSIDLVFTKNGEFIFLEINPVGQFGMTSFPCNYFIEREIAKTLQV